MLASWKRQQSTEKSRAALPACSKCYGASPLTGAAFWSHLQQQDTTTPSSTPCVGSAGHKLLPEMPTQPSLIANWNGLTTGAPPIEPGAHQ